MVVVVEVEEGESGDGAGVTTMMRSGGRTVVGVGDEVEVVGGGAVDVVVVGVGRELGGSSLPHTAPASSPAITTAAHPIATHGHHANMRRNLIGRQP